MQGVHAEKQKNVVRLKKHRRFQKNCRLRHRTPLTVRAIIRTFTYGTEEVEYRAMDGPTVVGGGYRLPTSPIYCRL